MPFKDLKGLIRLLRALTFCTKTESLYKHGCEYCDAVPGHFPLGRKGFSILRRRFPEEFGGTECGCKVHRETSSESERLPEALRVSQSSKRLLEVPRGSQMVPKVPRSFRVFQKRPEPSKGCRRLPQPPRGIQKRTNTLRRSQRLPMSPRISQKFLETSLKSPRGLGQTS